MALGPAGAFGQPAAEPDLARAKELFERGLGDMQAGRYETGCPALAESYRLGGKAGALFTLAECESRAGKLASALARYQEYLAIYVRLAPEERERQGDRQAMATAQLKTLESVVPRLTVVLPEAAPAESRVSLDDRPLDRAALGSAMPIDAGSHRVVAEIPGAPPRSYEVTLAPGERRQVVIEIETAKIPEPAPAPPPQPAPSEEEPEGGGAMRIAGLVVGGIGAAAVITGAVTGAMALGKRSTVLDNCDDAGFCNAEGKAAADETQLLGNVSTVTFVVGGAALAAGVLLFVLAPSDASDAERARAPRLRFGWQGASLGGRW
jgi:hypothetical protein